MFDGLGFLWVFAKLNMITCKLCAWCSTMTNDHEIARPQAYRVFISSTFLNLIAERKSVREALSDLNYPLASLGVCLIPVDLQGGADSRPPLDVCIQQVATSDLLISLLGHRAGWLTDDGRSITECEFDHANANNMPVLAYVCDNEIPVLPKDIDQDDKHVAALKRLKSKIDDNVKRDTFRNSEHLRGHVLRDVLHWVLNLPEVLARSEQPDSPSSLPALKEYLELINSNHIAEAVDLIVSHKFGRDMKRHGTESIHRDLVRDLLELGKLEEPARVTDSYLRSRLLLTYISDFQDSSFVGKALEEAKELENEICHPHYTFHVARSEAKLQSKFETALPALKRMLRAAHEMDDIHEIAEAMRAIAESYSKMQGDHQKAKRWYWRSIQTLCKMEDICPHCLAMAFLGAADEELHCEECGTTNNRLLKAYQIGVVIPDRRIQASALVQLSRHLDAHDYIHEAVACAKLAARFTECILPTDPEHGLEAILSQFVVKRGRDQIANVLSEVEGKEESYLQLLIEEHKVEHFAKQLKLQPSTAGDHDLPIYGL